MSIREKYLLLLTLLFIVAAGLAAGLTSFLLSDSLDRVSHASEERVAQALVRQLEQEGIRRTQLLAWSLSDALYQTDVRTIAILTRASRSQKGVLAIDVYDKDAIVLHDGTKKLLMVGKVLENSIVREALNKRHLVSRINDNTIEVTVPVVIGRHLLGGVYMVLDKKIVADEIQKLRNAYAQIEAKNKASRYTVMIGLMVVFGLFGIVVANYLSRNMAHPVRLLTKYTKLIGKIPAIDIMNGLQRLEKRQDEIGQLSRAIVAATQELEATTVSRDHVSGLLRAIPDPMMVVDMQGNITEVTPAMAEQVGMSEQELCGRLYSDFLDCSALVLSAMQSGKITSVAGVEGSLIDPHIPVLVAAAYFEDGMRRQRRVVIAVRDIQELVKTQDALRTTRDQAQSANLAKSTFLANMSHEFRTPLNAIIGFTELLIMDPPSLKEPGQKQEYYEIIRDSGRHLLEIINDVLDMSKIETGKMELDERKIFLEEPVRSAVSMMCGRATEAQTDIVLEMDSSLEAYVDPRLFRQIVLNLLSNAIKFTEAGGQITVILRRNRLNQIIFAIIDSGIGMNANDVKRVMRPFEQADDSLDRKYEGTGLGLPLVNKMVILHGGVFRLFSRPGRGTIAFICLPAQ